MVCCLGLLAARKFFFHRRDAGVLGLAPVVGCERKLRTVCCLGVLAAW